MAAKKTARKPTTPKPDKAASPAESSGFVKDEPANDDDAPAVADVLRAVKFRSSALIGEVGEFLLSKVRHAREQKAWNKLSEAEQRDMILHMHDEARRIVAGVARAISMRGLPYAIANIEGGSFKMGDGSINLKCVIDFNTTNADMLSTGRSRAVIVFSDLAEFEGDMTTQPDPDEPTLLGTDPRPDDDIEGVKKFDRDTGEIEDDDDAGAAETPISLETQAAAP